MQHVLFDQIYSTKQSSQQQQQQKHNNNKTNYKMSQAE